MNINIERENIIVRRFREEDAKDASDYSRKKNVAYWMADMVMHDEDEALKWIRWINEEFSINKAFVFLAVEHKQDKKCIGFVGVHPQPMVDNEVEISYSISDQYAGNGYITEASSALIQWVFNNTEQEKLVAIVKPDNIASNSVVRKLGFESAGIKMAEYCGEMCEFNYYRLYK